MGVAKHQLKQRIRAALTGKGLPGIERLTPEGGSFVGCFREGRWRVSVASWCCDKEFEVEAGVEGSEDLSMRAGNNLGPLGLAANPS